MHWPPQRSIERIDNLFTLGKTLYDFTSHDGGKFTLIPSSVIPSLMQYHSFFRSSLLVSKSSKFAVVSSEKLLFS